MKLVLKNKTFFLIEIICSFTGSGITFCSKTRHNKGISSFILHEHKFVKLL